MFEPQNSLEVLLIKASADPGQRAAFQRALLESDLLAATPEAPKSNEGWRTLETSETVSLLNVNGPDGAPVTAVFTSERRVAECFGPGAGYLRMAGGELLDLVVGNGAFLNPGSAYGVHWTPEHLAALLGKPVSSIIEKDTKVLLGVPAEPPEALVKILRQLLLSEKRVSEAWFALAHWPEVNESSWYLDVRTELPGEQIQALLAKAFQTASMGDRPLNMVVNPVGSAEGVGIRLVPMPTH